MSDSLKQFEDGIRELTIPINGQYPRPWMTKLFNPLEANVFIVGKNQRNGYATSDLGSHQRHLDALFNRNGETCRRMYDEMTNGRPSPTRANTDRLVSLLESKGVDRILETNVICYSTPMSADLRSTIHTGGSKRGEEIFRFLIDQIKPKLLIVHGSGSTKKLSSVLGHDLVSEPSHEDDVRIQEVGGCLYAVIPSLAPPAYNKWSSWAVGHLEKLSAAIADRLR